MSKYWNTYFLLNDIFQYNSNLQMSICILNSVKFGHVYRFMNMISSTCFPLLPRKALRLSFLFGVTYAFSQVLVFFAYIITFRFGAFQVTLPTDNVASAMFQDIYRAFAAIIFVSIGIGAVGAFIPDSSKANAAVDKVFTVINRPLVIDTSSELGHKPDTWNGVVQFRAVDFSYPSRKKIKILDNLNLTLKGNRTVGLVGASGSGKSTIMTLLQRFYDPSHGSVSLDGNDFKDINLKWLRSQIGIVAQEPVLFDASIADNIRYGALFRDVSEDEIISAAKQANIHDFIETLPMVSCSIHHITVVQIVTFTSCCSQGYNTNAGAKGAQMSGGQKQRIAIARALVRDPKILLLDEATSALDTESEKVVQEALDKAREGRTTIIIAHRLSTIQNADKIAILEGGSVVEQGTHSELLSRKEGVYYRMVYNKNKAQE